MPQWPPITGTRTPRDVDYYDQFGVGRNATTEEIRHAYRSLVRLLHPDHQTDAELKAAAEKQLRKLNRIHAILIDPVKRREYDEYLADEWLPPVPKDEPNAQLRTNLIRAIWIGVGLLTVGLVFWMGSESSPGTESSVFTPAQSVPKQPSPKPSQNSNADNNAALREQLNRALVERDEALREVVRLRQEKKVSPPKLFPSESTASTAKQSAPVAAVTEPAPQIAEPAPVAAANPKSETTVAKRLSGSWFYVRPKEGQQNKNKSLYPPEFIEMTVQEENGSIKGKYRAKYRIVDRPIPPDVNFDFTGHDNNGNCACTWRGIGGAHGNITLQINGDHSMRFDWTATELGSQQGLASGTATLTRRSD